jgi:large subunit ribosomal protein L30
VAKLRITLVKSSIGYAKAQKRSLKALSLNRLNQTVTHNNCASIQGMINKVKHLVKVEKESL